MRVVVNIYEYLEIHWSTGRLHLRSAQSHATPKPFSIACKKVVKSRIKPKQIYRMMSLSHEREHVASMQYCMCLINIRIIEIYEDILHLWLGM